MEAAVRAVGFAVREYGAGPNKRRLVSRGVFTVKSIGLKYEPASEPLHITLDAGHRRPLSLKLSATKVYEPQVE